MVFNNKKIKNILFIGILVFVIFLLNVFSKNVRSFFYSFSAPIQKTLWSVGDRVSDFCESFLKASKLKEEKENLLAENQFLLSEISRLKKIEQENKELRKALGLGLEKNFKLSLAQVIGKDISQDVILIDKGKNDGILENTPVISAQKTLLGKVVKVYKKFSKVKLISEKDNSFDVKIQEKNIPGVLKGAGNLKIFLEFVPYEKDVSQGDIVVTSRLGGIFPEGLLIGRVKSVEKNDLEPFQKIEIEPAFELDNLNYLFLIINEF